MRNEVYDKMLIKGIEKIKNNPEKVTLAEQKLEVFETILNETNAENLAKYYRNMEEFLTVNGGVETDITKMSPHYIATETPHVCVGDECAFVAVESEE